MEPKVLVLTPWMAPHNVTTWQEAIVLWYTKKAEVLEEYEATVSSPSMSVRIPAVLRLLKAVPRMMRQVKFSRTSVYTRDQNRCCYCNAKLPARKLNYDHVRPRVQGGRTEWTNIVTACFPCNLRKGGRTPEQAGMEMRFKPYKPTTLPLGGPVVYDLDEMPEEWRPYLTQMTRTA